jgi:hypothetical protein
MTKPACDALQELMANAFPECASDDPVAFDHHDVKGYLLAFPMDPCGNMQLGIECKIPRARQVEVTWFKVDQPRFSQRAVACK